MSYLKMIEFLVKEVAKKDQEIKELGIALDHEVKSLSIELDSKDKLCKELEALSDKRLEELVAKDDAVGDAEANLWWIEDKLSEMTKEKDHWKAEALEYRDKEKQWWAEEDKLKSSIVSINQDRIKVVGKLEDEVRDNIVEIDYLAGYVKEKDEEIRELNEKIKELKDKNSREWATDFAYKHLKKAYEDNNAYYEERIAKLQVEINHLKNNK